MDFGLLSDFDLRISAFVVRNGLCNSLYLSRKVICRLVLAVFLDVACWNLECS
jgi:hypothetical protein